VRLLILDRDRLHLAIAHTLVTMPAACIPKINNPHLLASCTITPLIITKCAYPHKLFRL